MSSQHSYNTEPHHISALPPPLRRLRAPQPPSLSTTSLNNSAYGHGHGLGPSALGSNAQTPASATSLSAPFSLHTGSPYTPSPSGATAAAAAAAAASPIAMRGPVSLPSAPYNPQEWAQHGGASSSSSSSVAAMMSPMLRQQSGQNVTYAPRLRGPDEPMVSPPPPYSAASANSSSANTNSPATEFTNSAAPSSASTLSPGPMVVSIGLDRRSPNLTNNESPSSPGVPNVVYPPPPPASSRVRSTSRNHHADRLLSSMHIRNRGSNSTPQPSAIDTLHHNTSQLLDAAAQSPGLGVGPPGSRRAASADAIGSSSAARSPPYGSSPARDLGIAIPPPPPGPPPTTARSVSASRVMPHQTGGASFAPSQRTNPLLRGSDLGSIPPTPADWVDENLMSATLSERNNVEQPSSPVPEPQPWQRPLHVETNNIAVEQLTESPAAAEATTGAGAVQRLRRDSGGLARSPAVRNRSAQGLRERRSESKRRIGSGSGDSVDVEGSGDALSRPLQDIVISRETSIQRRPSTRAPRTDGSFQGLDEALRSDEGRGMSRAEGSARSTPRADMNPKSTPNSKSTPPVSPFSAPKSASRPSPNHLRLGAASSSVSRPLSHLLHMPNEETVRVTPLSPESSRSLMDFEQPESPKTFAERAVERHRIFSQKEANATSDSERLHIFAQYMKAESRIRRDKYSAVFKAERVELSDLLSGMFEDMRKDTIRAPGGKDEDSTQESRRSSGTSYVDSRSHSRPASTTATEPLQLTLDTTVMDPRPKTFIPALSPIASMSAVTGRDEMDSRGRAPSRWWEGQSNSSSHGEGFDILKRSKRESKYMSAVLEDEQLPSFEHGFAGDSGSSQQPPVYGENEYPPEKVGWHEPSSSTPQPSHQPQTPHSAPFTPDPRKLDISRLITLPPPYPRHHPAVNNSHPDLGEVRNTMRSLHELGKVGECKERFEIQLREKRERANSWCDHQRFMHDQDIQFRIERGEITQDEYDAAERGLEEKVSKSKKDMAQATFDLYQTVAVTPVHALLKDRLNQADAAFSGLASRLNSDSETHSPNLPQEAGDEKPELLEKLTMLKWLFEARETLHREKHILLTQRNDYYREVITTPYKILRNSQKLSDAEAFFASDTRKRQTSADTATHNRWKDFLAVIETHVTRGVEVQLSAFWDIAPPMQAVLQRIPDSRGLAGFEILIPRHEVDENPAYWRHPLRYLYSVLAHAGASSHQFVEGQISLWCLLQEVREGCVGARWRARESQRREASEGTQGLDRNDEAERRREISQGVEDLKEKVGAVEGQWIDGLGGEIGRVREAVREWLEMSGGWDDELESGE